MIKVFIAIYTNKVKQYCDVEFFEHIDNLTYHNKEVHIIDNTIDIDYFDRLSSIVSNNYDIYHTYIPREPVATQFHRNVCESVNFLRDKFLQSDCSHFLIIESDVMVPPNTIELLIEVIDMAEIIGGIYYHGYHPSECFDDNFNDLVYPSCTILSGCTLYSRKLIEQVKFRFDENYLAPFPDAFMSLDASNLGFKVANYCKIKCTHKCGRSGEL